MLWEGFASFIGGVALSKSAQYFPYLSAVLTLAFFIALCLRKKPLLIAVVIAGALFAFARERPLCEPPARQMKKSQMRRSTVSFTGYASAATRLENENKNGFSQIFHITSPPLPGRGLPFDKVRIYTARPFPEGKLYEIKAMAGLPAPRLDPGFPNSSLMPKADILWAGKAGAAPFAERMRSRLNEYYMRNFPPEEAGLLMSVTTGERAWLSGRTKQDFGNCGLAHLISIAGLHFGMFGLSIFLLISFFLRFLVPLKVLERLTLHIRPKQLAALVCLPLLAGYLLLSGMRIPALRAFIMSVFFLAGLLAGRPRAWLSALWFAAFALVLWRPDAVLDASFQMSFLSVLLIGRFAGDFNFNFTDRSPAPGPGEEARKKNRAGGKAVAAGIKKYLGRTFIVSFILAAGLAPLIIYYFNRVQLISPVANLVTVPVAGLLLVPAAVLSGFVYLATGFYPLPALSGGLASISIRLARFFSSIPYSSFPAPALPPGYLLVFYGLLFAYMLGREKNKKYLALAAAPLALWAGICMAKPHVLSITFLDDGTGESAVAELPDGKTAVMDTGANGVETADFLRSEGIGRIDFLILSHVHHDHTGGAEYLCRRFRTGEIWDNGLLVLDKNVFRAPERKLSRGDFLEGDGYRLTVLHPYRRFFTSGGSVSTAINNTSLVLKVEDLYGHSALFTGDIEREAQQDLLSLGGCLRSDVYKVPHHGSETSAWRPFIGAVRPAIAVITPGDENDFGFPDAETLRALSGSGARIKILRTDIDGAVKVCFEKKGIQIKTFKGSGLVRDPSGPAGEMHNLRVLFSSW